MLIYTATTHMMITDTPRAIYHHNSILKGCHIHKFSFHWYTTGWSSKIDKKNEEAHEREEYNTQL